MFVPQFVHFSDCANKTLARPPHEHHVYSMVCTPSFLPLSLCPSACPHPELASPSEHTTCCPSCSTTATLPTLPSLLLRGVPASTPLALYSSPRSATSRITCSTIRSGTPQAKSASTPWP